MMEKNAVNRAYFFINAVRKKNYTHVTSDPLSYKYQYVCEMWLPTKGDDKKWLVFEGKVLKKIYGSVYKERNYKRILEYPGNESNRYILDSDNSGHWLE